VDLLKLAIGKIDLPEGGRERETLDQIMLAWFQFVFPLFIPTDVESDAPPWEGKR
jgi:hypothetical protein